MVESNESSPLLQKNISLTSFSTFGIGGVADYFAEVTTIDELSSALQHAEELQLPILPIGKGSNCLFSDNGFRGVVIKLKLQDLTTDGQGLYRVGSGYSFAHLGKLTSKEGFSGLEFAAAIPASVGGAVFMNAGASGRETKDALQDVSVMRYDGTLQTLLRQDLHFSYRHSSLQELPVIIVSATFQLTRSSEAKALQQQIVSSRLKSQPYSDKSCGCAFKNPSQMMPAGRLIDECGLKGLRIGGAVVSDLHANFIVNSGGARAEDVVALLKEIRERVYEKTGQRLVSEIRLFDEYGKIVQPT